MTPYANLSRDSGVVNYETASDSITVQFHNGETYLYTYNSTGQHDIEQMKLFAQQGKGLGTYINTKVKKRYARKLR